MKMLSVEGVVCVVDDVDFDAVAKHRWRLHNQGYAYRKTCRGGRTVTLLMHREIMGAGKGMEVDHTNGCKMDNRRENLSVITPHAHRMKHIGKLISFQKRRQIYPDEKVCAVCGKTYTANPRKRKRQKCCGQKCAQVLRGRGRTIQAQSCRKSRRSSSKRS